MKKAVLLAGFCVYLSAIAAGAANYVIKTDGGRVYIDYGIRDGAVEGQSLRVYRVDTSVHPVTGRETESRVLIERNARILSASRDSSVILLPDSEIYGGMKIELEIPDAYAGRVPGFGGIRLSGEYISFSGSDTLYFVQAGYRYSALNKGIAVGAGGAENADERFYYGYASPEIRIEKFLLSASLMAGLTDAGTELGYGVLAAFGGQAGPVFEAGYSYYSSLGHKAQLEFRAGSERILSPVMNISWIGIPEKDGAVTVRGGFDIKLPGGSVIRPLAGVGGRDTESLGFAAGISAEIAF